MNLLELLRRMQAPAVDTETGYYDPYQSYYSPVRSLGNVGPRPKVKSVVTETEGQPRKITTTYDYSQPDTRNIGSLSMGPLSMMSAERRGYDPMLMEPEQTIPMDQLFTDTLNVDGGGGGWGDLTRNQIIEMASQNPLSQSLLDSNAAPFAAGIVNAAGQPIINAGTQIAAKLMPNIKGLLTAMGIGVSPVIPGLLAGNPKEEEYNPGVMSPDDAFQYPLPTQQDITPQVPPVNPTPGMLSTSTSERLPGNAPLEFVNQMYGDLSPEGRVIERAPYIDMRGFKTEGRRKEEAEQKEADRIYGDYSYNPADARKRYEDQMSKIYRNAMILNAIAQLTGGKSMADVYIASATKRFEMAEAFTDQERLAKIQRGIYYNKDGVYDPPKNSQEAFDRAMKFGAGAELASKVSGYIPKDTRAWNNWYRIVDGRLEETVARTGDKPEGKGWKKGTYSAPSGSGGTETERALDRVDALVAEGNVAGAIQELERAFAYKAAGDITSNQPNRLRDAVDIVWKSISPSLKIPVPENIKTPEQLAAWEKEQKAAGVRGYYRVGDELGIIQ